MGCYHAMSKNGTLRHASGAARHPSVQHKISTVGSLTQSSSVHTDEKKGRKEKKKKRGKEKEERKRRRKEEEKKEEQERKRRRRQSERKEEHASQYRNTTFEQQIYSHNGCVFWM